MNTRYAPRSVLAPLSDLLTLGTMAGLTLISAAALAGPMLERAEPVRLPTVVVTAKSTPAATAEPVRLPTVVVIAKRSS